MSRLDAPANLAAEVETLRRKRSGLLATAERRKWRIHRLPVLQRELRLVTQKLMRLELLLEAEQRNEPDEEPNLMWWQRG